jgi:hypothetical protein
MVRSSREMGPADNGTELSAALGENAYGAGGSRLYIKSGKTS